MSTHDFEPTPPPRSPLRRHAPRLLVLSAAALLLHAAILGGVDLAWPTGEAPRFPAGKAMQVRMVDPEVSALTVPAPAEAARPAADARSQSSDVTVSKPRQTEPRLRPVVARMPVVATEPAPAAALAPAPTRDSTTTQASMPIDAVVDAAETAAPMQLALATSAAPATAASTAASASAPKATAPGTAANTATDDDTIPHYRTRMPPAATLRYEVSRGMLHGTGDLVWRPQAERYELKLDFKLSGLTILSQSSSGAFDAAGIAPVRFTDQRFKRGTTAANFQREADKITYSGSSSEFPLRPGAQDRLSWMMQLAAIVAAEPQLAKPGGKVAMYVTGSHGDAGVWVFRCLGPDAVDVQGASVRAIKFVREPREPYDTAVQVWLDPARNDLPVRATQKSGANDEGYELRLLEVRAAS